MRLTRKQAEKIVDAILWNLDDRRGLHLDDIDQDTRIRMREEWIALAIKGGDGNQPYWVGERKET